MKTITANEARQLAGPNADDRVEEACEAIRAAASEKKREIILRESSFWGVYGHDKDPVWTETCKRLRNLGFTVDEFYEERQFVDIGTRIKW